MAYAALREYYSVKFITRDPTSPPEGHLVVIKETEAAKGNHTSILVPRCGRLVRVDSVLVAGSGTTIAPYLNGVLPDGVTTLKVWATLRPALEVLDLAIAPYLATSETLEHYADVDAGADNTITTAYYFVRDTWA